MKRPKVGPPCSPVWQSHPDDAPAVQEQEEEAVAAAAAMEESGAGWLECPLCLLAQPPEALPPLSCCAHRSCLACLQQYWCLELRESRVPLACPHCPAPLPPAEVERLLPEAGLRDKYEECLLRRLLLADPGTRWCPAPDCRWGRLRAISLRAGGRANHSAPGAIRRGREGRRPTSKSPDSPLPQSAAWASRTGWPLLLLSLSGEMEFEALTGASWDGALSSC